MLEVEPTGQRRLARSIRLSVQWRNCLGYRHAGCLQLSCRRPSEMCGLRTGPRTDVDPPRFLPPSNCHRRRGGIVSMLFSTKIYRNVEIAPKINHSVTWFCVGCDVTKSATPSNSGSSSGSRDPTTPIMATPTRPALSARPAPTAATR